MSTFFILAASYREAASFYIPEMFFIFHAVLRIFIIFVVFFIK